MESAAATRWHVRRRTTRFGEIIQLIDGQLTPFRYVSQMAYAPCTCPDETHCGLWMLMLDVRQAIARITGEPDAAKTPPLVPVSPLIFSRF